MSVSTRTRFEILKRDGFRCRYCGATATSTLLHVDHVLAVSNGGTDDHMDLVTSCADCNLGKSNVPLDEIRAKAGPTSDDAMEHALQIREYLKAQQAVEYEREAVVEWLADYWRTHVGNDPLVTTVRAMRAHLDTYSLDQLCEAIRATGKKERVGGFSRWDDSSKYFHGCLRNFRENKL